MDAYKESFIKLLLSKGALRFGAYTLKSGRVSPYFVNLGDLDDGESLCALGQAYASLLREHITQDTVLYGIPEKGVGLVTAASMELARMGVNVPWFFTRKMAKEHGEKSPIVGRMPKKGDTVIQLDDVFTAGDAKYEARETLSRLGDFRLPLLVIAIDRQEVAVDGKNAIATYEEKTGTKVVSFLCATDILDFLRMKNDSHVHAMEKYLQEYGTQSVKRLLG